MNGQAGEACAYVSVLIGSMCADAGVQLVQIPGGKFLQGPENPDPFPGTAGGAPRISSDPSRKTHKCAQNAEPLFLKTADSCRPVHPLL